MTTTGTETLRWYHHDQLGSTRALTSPTGTVLATYSYTPNGAPGSVVGTATTPIGWAGEYRDPETGYVYLRARYYDPATAQFLTRDPLEALTRSAYGYGYGYNDPINRTDPSGLAPWDGIGDWIGDRVDDVKCAAGDLWDDTLGQIFTCADTGASDVISAFGLVPPIQNGTKEQWGGTGAGYLLLPTGLMVTYGARNIERVALRGLVTAGGSILTAVTVTGTLYQLGRAAFCPFKAPS